MSWRLQKSLVMACSCECDVPMLYNSLRVTGNVCWTQLWKQPLLMLHAGFATDTQQLLQRGLMSGSEYTCKLVQVCLPEPSELVVMCDKRKRQCVCLCQVYKSCLDGLLPSYQAFYKVFSRLNKHQATLLSGQDNQLLVALAGMDVSVPNVAVVNVAEPSTCAECQLLSSMPLMTSDSSQPISSGTA